jgi:hypothetical protein
MAAVQFTTLVKTVARRAWHDVEPKLYAWLATGVSATAVISFAQSYLGVTVTVPEAGLVVTLLGFAAGYIKRSVSSTEVQVPAPVSVAPARVLDPTRPAAPAPVIVAPVELPVDPTVIP